MGDYVVLQKRSPIILSLRKRYFLVISLTPLLQFILVKALKAVQMHSADSPDVCDQIYDNALF